MKAKIIALALVFGPSSFYCFSQQGLYAEYFNGANFERKVLTRTDAQINFYWDQRPPAKGMNASDFSVRWTGRLLAEETGTYTFSALVDDGLRLWVGGTKVIDAWGPHNHESVTGELTLTTGQMYDLKVEYFNGILEGQIQLLCRKPSDEKSIFDWFKPKGNLIEPGLFFLPKTLVTQLNAIDPEKKVENPTLEFSEKIKAEKEPGFRPSATRQAAALATTANPKGRMRDTITKYTPKNILFEPGQPFLMEESYPELNVLIKLLKRFPSLKIRIDGHTDITGDPQINMTLSQDRANEVSYYLTENGIDPKRITTKGFGASRPLFARDSTRMYPQNRRVEFRIE